MLCQLYSFQICRCQIHEFYGLYKPQAIVGGLIQMVCFISCVASAIVSVKAMASGQKGKFKYIVNILGNAVFASGMIVFELMNFGGSDEIY